MRSQLSASTHDLGENEFFPEITSKDERIKKLLERNNILQSEVIKVERVLAASQSKPTYGVRLPNIKTDVMRRELQNAYKMIKQYQYEINKRKSKDIEGAFVDVVQKSEKILQEKRGLIGKFQKEIQQIKKLGVDHTKLLKDDSLKRENEDSATRINADIKFIHQKIKESQAKNKICMDNFMRQKQYITKLENEVIKIENGVHMLESLKQKYFNPAADSQPIEEHLNFQAEDFSIDSYNNSLNEVRLLKKLEKDYELRVGILSKEKDEAITRNLHSRNRLLEAEYEIDQLQQQMQEIKRSIDPRCLKPRLAIEQSTSAPLINPNKIKPSISHLFKYLEVGAWTKVGKRFSDRAIIGKQMSKIIAVKLFQNSKGVLIGLQATYLVNKQRRRGAVNLLADQKLVEVIEKETVLIEGDYIKSVDCMLDQRKVLLGLAMVSERNVSIKAGAVTANRVTLNMESAQYPICFYGCLLEEGMEMFGVEVGV